jgi:hypothetical protein
MRKSEKVSEKLRGKIREKVREKEEYFFFHSVAEFTRT